MAKTPITEPHLLELSQCESEIINQALALYELSFPPAERDPAEGIAASIQRVKEVDVRRGYVPHHFATLQDGQVTGISFYGYFCQARLGFLYYLAVDPAQRGQGLGGWLFRKTAAQLSADASACQGEPPRGLVWEVERPVDAETPDEHSLRQRRIAFYERQGAQLLEGLDFLAPPLGEDLPPVRYHIMFLPAPGYNGDPNDQSFRIDVLDVILLRGYGLERESHYYQDVVKKVTGNV
jgi:GNAT superfamily N-acetyltransferase